MILAEKIVTLRKRAGWSQEELAAQLGVSRQSVSKWEGAQSVPDMQKVVQMSRLFGVTTDYLLKEELGEPEPAPAGRGYFGKCGGGHRPVRADPSGRRRGRHLPDVRRKGEAVLVSGDGTV